MANYFNYLIKESVLEKGYEIYSFYEIYFFLEGSVIYSLEDTTHTLREGDILIIKPGEYHGPVFSTCQQAYERIVLWVSRTFLDQLSSLSTRLNTCFLESNSLLVRPDIVDQSKISFLLKELLQEQKATL